MCRSRKGGVDVASEDEIEGASPCMGGNLRRGRAAAVRWEVAAAEQQCVATLPVTRLLLSSYLNLLLAF